jgi:hypothetical protein
MGLHDAMGNAQTEAGPGYLIFNGGASVESFENPGLFLDCDARNQ